MTQYVTEIARLLAQKREVDQAISMVDRIPGPLQSRRWSCSAKLNEKLQDHLEQAIRAGAGNPDRPIELSFADTCLLNFGTTVELIELDLKTTLAEKADDFSIINAELPDELKAGYRRALGFLEMNYSELHASSGVYNLEPWLQEMYSDCLDVDQRQILYERAAMLQEDVRAVPERLHSLGIPDRLVTQIMAALRNYLSVQEQARARERAKTSMLGAREHAAATNRVQKALQEAESYMHFSGETAGGYSSPLEELFATWKDARFELIGIENELKGYFGSGMTAKLNELHDMLRAVWQTSSRSAEEEGYPQYNVISATQVSRICPRQVIEEELEALLMHDIIGNIDLAAERMEIRRFGPLCALIVPGCGNCAYSIELRKVQSQRLELGTGGKRDYDLDRRANYPLNFIVVPSLVEPQMMLESMAGAFLEYKAISSPVAFRNTMRESQVRFPEVYEVAPAGNGSGRQQKRRQFARYLAAFVRWAKYGRIVEDLPRIQEFIAWARGLLRRPEFLILPRYHCVLDDFAEASPQRREAIFVRHMRERRELDRQCMSLCTLQGDISRAIEWSGFLSAAMRANPYYKKALEPAADRGPWGKQNAERLFQRFIFSEPELKRTYNSLDMRFNAELDTIRHRALDTLGKEISAEEAAAAIGRRHEQMLQTRRDQANERIDRDLVGLLYCVEKNYTAARAELTAYLEKLEEQRHNRSTTVMRFDGSSLREMLGNRGKRLDAARAAGKAQSTITRLAGDRNLAAIHEDDFVYYNLGMICIKTGDLQSASDYFSRFCLWAAQQHWHLFGEYAREINEELDKN